MGNIIDYAREEQRSFEELPFNEVDALILAQLAYEDIPRLVPALDDERNHVRHVPRQDAPFPDGPA